MRGKPNDLDCIIYFKELPVLLKASKRWAINHGADSIPPMQPFGAKSPKNSALPNEGSIVGSCVLL